MLSFRLRAVAAMLVVVAALAACDSAQNDDPAGDQAGVQADDGGGDGADGDEGADSDDDADSDDGAVTVGTDLVNQPDAEVEMRMFDFRPGEVEIAVGETVEFRNTDETLHTVTSDDGVFDEELDGSGEVVQITFEEPGTYSYACRPHPFMTGTVTVTS